MAKVVIKSISAENDYGDIRERTEVFVDDTLIGKGSYGGEPEDNARYRDYGWVEVALERLAKALGADVTVESVEKAKEDA